MRIYHYTSIDALASILKSRSIRFSRLDLVDDPMESFFPIFGIKAAGYVFVSCWTNRESENIPQWIMYGAGLHGVRISLDSDMFEIYRNGEYSNLLPFDPVRKINYYTVPFGPGERFFKDILYVNDVYSLPMQSVHMSAEDGTNFIDFTKIGYIKSKDWEFQKECRFFLRILPEAVERNKKNNSFPILDDKILPFTHLDLHIKKGAFESMRVMLGPSATHEEEIVVDALLSKYLKGVRSSKSLFWGKTKK